MNREELGKIGEKIAQNYLREKGYKILARNYQVSFSGKKFGEIDIITQKKSFFHRSPICFIEVKTILENPYFFPEDKIDFSKKKKLKKLAEIYLTEKKIPLNTKYQIDLIGIKINPLTKEPKISHFENIIED